MKEHRWNTEKYSGLAIQRAFKNAPMRFIHTNRPVMMPKQSAGPKGKVRSFAKMRKHTPNTTPANEAMKSAVKACWRSRNKQPTASSFTSPHPKLSC